ncbi:uncharacterized protein LOC111123198 isoform X2 [Crassostrea virginica]
MLTDLTPCPSRQLSQVSDDSGVGSLDMTQECLDDLAIKKTFVFIKENLIFESVHDELTQKHLLLQRDKDNYVCKIPSRHFRVERLLKLIIRKKLCAEFIEILKKMPCHQHVYRKVLETRQKQAEPPNNAVNTGPNFTITHDLLQKHFTFLYQELEPRDIADQMFQACHISVSDHDAMTDDSKKFKRLKELLDILRRRNLYIPFLYVLHSLRYFTVLDTLQRDRKLKVKPSEYVLCIQQNLTLLKEELPDTGDAKLLMEHLYGFLDQTNISDIEDQVGATCQKSKLLKILIMKGKLPCKELFRVMEVDLERGNLIEEMKTKSAHLRKRGRPVLDTSLRTVNISCLQEHEEVLQDELEPVYICDLLFEERAVDIPDHDRVTEARHRQKQIKHLLDTVKENKNDCFHFFLYILQKEESESILQEFKTSPSGAVGTESSEDLEWRLSHSIMRLPDDVRNDSVDIRLSVTASPQMEQALYTRLQSTETEILEEAISLGQMDLYDISSGSVVLQLRPLTDQATQTLLNAKENNHLLEMIFGMLKRVNISQMMDGSKPLEIKVQVCYASTTKPKSDSKTTKAALIQKLIKAHRNTLVSELEPRALTSSLSEAFPKDVIDRINSIPSSRQKIDQLLCAIEDGEATVVEKFVSALQDLGYCDIVELIDPTNLHSRAENIRKMITSNYKNILDEMQITLARETLSKCIGDVKTIKENILPKNGKRQQRMSKFLQFILQEDHNVIEFEKMLRNNGLEELLKINEDSNREHLAPQDIEVRLVEDLPTTEGVLFESTITLSFTVKSNRENKTMVPEIPEERGPLLDRTGAGLSYTPDSQPPTTMEKQGLERTPVTPEKGESFSSVSSSVSLQSIISDAEEEKSKDFTKEIPVSFKRGKTQHAKSPSLKEVRWSSSQFEQPLLQASKEIPVKSSEIAHSYGQSTYQKDLSLVYQVVAAIDFGTTYSGYAYSWKDKQDRFHTIKSSTKFSEKEPSVLLMDQSEELIAFGHDAELKYKDLCEDELQQNYFYFQHFKMNLHSDENLSRKTIIMDDKGRECSAVKVFSMSIKYFKKRLLNDLGHSRTPCAEEHIRWVLTVPAIWGEQAKQFMQESSYQAGIPPSQLMLALEPEVASVFVKEIQIEKQADEILKYRPGKKFLIMDLGGGTADLTAMEVMGDGSLKQLYCACGGDWGGNQVNKNFFNLLYEMFGPSVVQQCEIDHRSDYLDLQEDIEVQKRSFNKSDSYRSLKFKIPYSYQKAIEGLHGKALKTIVANSHFSQDISVDSRNRLKLSAKCIETLLFNPVVNKIKQETENVLHELQGRIEDIMMVGGFSESRFVYETIRESFPRFNLVLANEAGLAVLKGAVLYGHTPAAISSRKCAFTYGVGLYRHFLKGDPEHLKCRIEGEENILVFVKMVTMGDEVGIGETITLDEDIRHVRRDASHMSLKVYRSEKIDPQYVDESSVQIGKLTVKDVTKSVKISLSFGLTQITVMAVNTDTGKNVNAELDLLGDL